MTTRSAAALRENAEDIRQPSGPVLPQQMQQHLGYAVKGAAPAYGQATDHASGPARPSGPLA